jgi:hypothetical protein
MPPDSLGGNRRGRCGDRALGDRSSSGEARSLGVGLLQETLDEEGEADKKLSELAASSINIQAAETDNDTMSDREVAVASSMEVGPRGRRTRTSAHRGSTRMNAR